MHENLGSTESSAHTLQQFQSFSFMVNNLQNVQHQSCKKVQPSKVTFDNEFFMSTETFFSKHRFLRISKF